MGPGGSGSDRGQARAQTLRAIRKSIATAQMSAEPPSWWLEIEQCSPLAVSAPSGDGPATESPPASGAEPAAGFPIIASRGAHTPVAQRRPSAQSWLVSQGSPVPSGAHTPDHWLESAMEPLGAPSGTGAAVTGEHSIPGPHSVSSEQRLDCAAESPGHPKSASRIHVTARILASHLVKLPQW